MGAMRTRQARDGETVRNASARDTPSGSRTVSGPTNVGPVTIVMYHYVLPIGSSVPWKLKGLHIDEFRGQLGYIARHYNTVSLSDVAAARAGEGELPPNACVLTFDDGLALHHDIVLPMLSERGMRGTFFASSAPVLTGEVLSAHKIHILLGSGVPVPQLVREIFEEINAVRGDCDLPDNLKLYESLAVAGRYDPPDVVFVKRALQRELPREIRRGILSRLFSKYISDDEEAISREFYMSMDQMRSMVAAGMEIGGHGMYHRWFAPLTDAESKAEIDASKELLAAVYGTLPRRWVMAYPYGSYNGTTVRLLRAAGCAAAVTVRVDLARDMDPLLTLPRLDANDLPKEADAPLSRWTKLRAEYRA